MRRKHYVIMLILASFIVIGCDEDSTDEEDSESESESESESDTKLELTIDVHPQGGNAVQNLSCEYTVNLVDGEMPINLTMEWWWESGDEEDTEMVESDVLMVNNVNPSSYSTTYSAGSGFVLMNYYFVKFKWTNENGESMEQDSSKAYCTNN